jgi:hypothetical protein
MTKIPRSGKYRDMEEVMLRFQRREGGNHLIFSNYKKAYGTRCYDAKGRREVGVVIDVLLKTDSGKI